MQQVAYQWINRDEQLKQACRQARLQAVVALDTEFIRTRTYYAKLGLIQLYDGIQVSLIDPLEIQDFSPFIELLADLKVVKILHACSEDLDVFYHTFRQLPTPMMDTQIMAGFLGLGQSVGFAKLVQHYLDIELDKGASRTDWLARPLSETQLQYAVADVWYLLPVYYKLAETLAQSRWFSAVEEECRVMGDKIVQPLKAESAYKEIGNAWQLSPQELAILQVVAKWRIEEAQKRDLALNFVVKEQSLWHIAKSQPKHTSALLDFMHPNEVRIHGKKLISLVEQAKSLLPHQYPAPITRLVDDPMYKKALKTCQTKLAEIQPNDLPIELLASKRQLNQLFKWNRNGRMPEKMPELLSGWRRPFGEMLLESLDGLLSTTQYKDE